MNQHTPTHRVVTIMIGLTLWFVCPAGANDVVLTTKRLMPEQPAHGHFVKSDQGYMVPYTARIPGTDVTFDMVPVPADASQGGNATHPFWIGKYEVTLREYQPYMNLHRSFRKFQNERIRSSADDIDAISAASKVYEPVARFDYASGAEFDFDARAPAASMTRYAARQYTKWLSLISQQQYRLPTESEWERACRAGTAVPWSFGRDMSKANEFCVINDGQRDGPNRIGSCKPNQWGIHDMHGNVAEWVVVEKELRDHRKFDLDSYQRNKIDPTAKPVRAILKGGDWTKHIKQCIVQRREYADPQLWEYDPCIPHSCWWTACEDSSRVGFRIVSPLQPHPRDEIEMYWGPDDEKLAEEIDEQMAGGRGVLGLVDPALPQAIAELE